MQRAALPIAAALGGMVVPALIYLAFNAGGAGHARLGRPDGDRHRVRARMLSLLGDRIPRGLRVFLLALAIVDDLGAMLVIALFYTEAVDGCVAPGGAAGCGARRWPMAARAASSRWCSR